MDEDRAVWENYVKRVTPLGAARRGAPLPYLPLARPPLPDAIDLHGLPVHDAYRATLFFLACAKDAHRAVTVITGRSGAIRREFPFWVAHRPEVRRCEALNGGGAFRLHLRRSKP